MGEDVEETNSGVKKKGSWKEVAEFGEEVSEKVEEVDESSGEEFEEWRPKTEEAENDMKRKTVEKASLSQKKLEEESEGPVKDIENGTKKLAEAGKKSAGREVPQKEVREASENFLKPFYSSFVKSFRKFESILYSRLSLKTNPMYFDTGELSASLKSNGKDYQMEINSPDIEMRQNIKEEFREE